MASNTDIATRSLIVTLKSIKKKTFIEILEITGISVWLINQIYARYQIKIFVPKLFPFAKECEKNQLGIIVQEDKAPAHDHYIQHQIYNIYNVQKML